VENFKMPGEYEHGAGPSSMVNSLYSASLATVLTNVPGRSTLLLPLTSTNTPATQLPCLPQLL
jgi:hypothetical protein